MTARAQELWPKAPEVWPHDKAPNTAPVALVPPDDWRGWLDTLFARYVRGGYAERHVTFWDWLWQIRLTDDPDPFVGIWPRGGAKSSSAELGTVALGVRDRRRYAWYVRDTQPRADDSVQNIGALLESSTVAKYYPDHGSRQVGKFGDSKGWRRNRLRTVGGFTVDALGLDVAARGAKMEDQRPDLIVIDDVDNRHDTPDATEKKLATIKDSLLPAGAANCAVIAIQNLIIPHGVFARLADGTADFLARRIVSGPEPAIRGLETVNVDDPKTGIRRAVITGGVPTWQGQGLKECQQLMDKIGLGSFKREAQHEVKDREGALWTSAMIQATRVSARAPRYKRIVVAVDPSGGGDDIGIGAAALRYDGHVDVLKDATQPGKLGTRNWGKTAVDLYDDEKADRLLAEKNFGGDMVESNIKAIDPRVPVKLVHASRGKDVRAEPVATLYSEGKVHHVGYFPELEAEMTGWVPGDPDSPNRVDWLVWAVTELLLTTNRVPRVAALD